MKIISFEGIEGVGKSTQLRLLKDYLESKNFLVGVYREPGSTNTGEKIRDILLNSSNELSNEAELLLMFASRSELIKPETTICLGELRFAGVTIVLISSSTLEHISLITSRSTLRTAHIDPFGHFSISFPLL